MANYRKRKTQPDQPPVIIMQDGNTKRVLKLPQKRRESSALFYGISRFLLPVLVVLIFAALADKYDSGPKPQSALMYADPTRDYQPTPDLSWKTPYPEGWLKTPENLQAILSKTPITPAPTGTPAPTRTPAPTQTAHNSPTTAPLENLSVGPLQTANAERLLAEAARDIERDQVIADKFNGFISFMSDVVSYLCAGSMTIVTIILIVLVATRVKREMALIRAENERAAILANPVLAYPKGTRAEIENVLNLIKANVKYYHDHGLDPNEEIKIMRHSYLEGINTDQWTRATDSLVRRGYAMKQPGKSTILKYNLSVGAMFNIINQALYLDTNSIALTLQTTPS